MYGTYACTADGICRGRNRQHTKRDRLCHKGAVNGWYFLGKDGGVDGDNTIIFAASPIATNQRFDGFTTNMVKYYDPEWKCEYLVQRYYDVQSASNLNLSSSRDWQVTFIFDLEWGKPTA